MSLKTGEAPRAHFGISDLTHTASRVVGNMCFEACEATCPKFCIALLANSTPGKVGNVGFEACEAARPDFSVAPLANAAARDVGNMGLEASKTSWPELSIAPLADATSIPEAIQVASEARCAELLVSSATDCTARRRAEVVLDMLVETCKAASSYLGKTASTHTTSASMAINHASETAGTTKLAVSSLAHGAATKNTI